MEGDAEEGLPQSEHGNRDELEVVRRAEKV